MARVRTFLDQVHGRTSAEPFTGQLIPRLAPPGPPATVPRGALLFE
jgi:hypothetical protein